MRNALLFLGITCLSQLSFSKDEICPGEDKIPSYEFKDVQNYGFVEWSSGGAVQGADDSMWFGTNDGKLHRFTRQGAFVQAYTVDGAVSGKPALIKNGPNARSLVFGTMTGKLYLWDPKLNIVRQLVYKAGGRVRSTPVVYPDGSFVVLNDAGALSYYRPDGTPELDSSGQPKVVDLKEATLSSALLMPDGKIGVPTGSGKILFVGKDGAVKTYFANSPISTKPALDGMGRLVVGALDGRVHVVNSDAVAAVPSFPLSGQIAGKGGIFSNGTSVFSTGDGVVHFRKRDGSKAAIYDQGVPCSADIVVRDNFAYVGCDDGTLNVFDESGNKYAEYRTQSGVVGAPLVFENGDVVFSNLEPRMFLARLGKSQPIAQASAPFSYVCDSSAAQTEAPADHFRRSKPN